MAVGNYIRNQRLPHVSMRQLAKDIGISASYLSDVENDRRKISYKMAMRITAALYRYVGGPVHGMFEVMLMLSGLLTPERDCLKRLYESAFPHWNMEVACVFKPSTGDVVVTHVSYNDVYKALYGELDEYINGADQPNMLEQQQVADTNSWENPDG